MQALMGQQWAAELVAMGQPAVFLPTYDTYHRYASVISYNFERQTTLDVLRSYRHAILMGLPVFRRVIRIFPGNQPDSLLVAY